MGEFQYYEWQTLDRPLTEKEQAEVRRLSSHIEVTSTRAVVTYDWGDFKHDPDVVLARYFDAHFYWAEWGSKRFGFRFPAEADLTVLEPYLFEDWITFNETEGAQVLSINFEEQDEPEWESMENLENLLPVLASMRNDILQRDYRLPYLAWLKAMADAAWGDYADEEYLDEMEPPVPPGLQNLTSALSRFAKVFGLSPSLIEAAAQASPDLYPISDHDLRQAVKSLPRSVCDEILLRLAKNETGLSYLLNQQLKPYLPAAGAQAVSQRTVGELFDQAKWIEIQARERAALAAEQKRIRELEALAEREIETWNEIYRLIADKLGPSYDKAVALLCQLRDLGGYQDRQASFQKQVAVLRENYKNRPALLERLRRAGLG